MIDVESAKISGEVAWIRLRTRIRLMISLIGIGLVLVAVFNMYAPAYTDFAAVAPYREPVLSMTGLRDGATYIADLLVLGIGLILGWFA